MRFFIAFSAGCFARLFLRGPASFGALSGPGSGVLDFPLEVFLRGLPEPHPLVPWEGVRGGLGQLSHLLVQDLVEHVRGLVGSYGCGDGRVHVRG